MGEEFVAVAEASTLSLAEEVPDTFVLPLGEVDAVDEGEDVAVSEEVALPLSDPLCEKVTDSLALREGVAEPVLLELGE